MLTSLLAYIQTREAKANCLDYLLPRLIRHYQADFRHFADCGAGVGHTSRKYAQELAANLEPSLLQDASIAAFEPLPENYAELKTRIEAYPQIEAIPKAVADYVGEAEFVVPARMQGVSSHWGAGTSAVGYLGKSATAETVKVAVTRLEDVRPSGFDFIKLDLQGGERMALRGAGDTLRTTKLIYAEHQLLAPRQTQALDFLTANGFVCFMDRLQFGLRDVSEPPYSLLDKGGIKVSRMREADGRGLSMILWGEMDYRSGGPMLEDGNLEPDFVRELIAAGVYYLQTDIVAIQADIYPRVVSIIRNR